jgi:hypothetical protein
LLICVCSFVLLNLKENRIRDLGCVCASPPSSRCVPAVLAGL